MDNIIVYGLGFSFDNNIDFISNHYNVVGYSDINPAQMNKVANRWIPVEDISGMMDRVDYLLVTFRRPLGVIDTEDLCINLGLPNEKIRYLWYEMNKIYYEDFEYDSYKNTQKYLNEKQLDCLNKAFNNHYFCREFRITGGSAFKDKVFFIIRYGLARVGLFTAYNVFAGYIKYAIDNGYIPVIDMQNYPNIYLTDEEYGNINAWDYYFEQPCGYCLKDAYSASNIIMSDLGLIHSIPVFSEEFVSNQRGQLDMWRRLSHTYMNILPKIKKEIIDSFNQLRGDSRVLGVYCRGTDYVKRQYPGHPVQPDPKQVLEDTKRIIRDQKCDKVFLGTEDKDIADLFKKEFGDKYITNSREFIEYRGGATCLTKVDRENDRYLQGKEYLTTMVMCALCDCILTSRAGGSLGFYMITDGWDYEKVYFLGEYPERDFDWKSNQ